jgi:hypothetical protein
MIERTAFKSRRMAVALLSSLAGLAVAIPAGVAANSESRSGDSYVFFTPGGNSSSMSGSRDDWRRAQALRNGKEGLLFVRRGGTAFVIRDAATLRKADAIFEPQRALGAKQAELGSRQADLGARQARLGAEQARFGVQQASSSTDRAEQLRRQQDALGRQQGELGRRQGELGRQQGELGRQQGELARLAEAKLRDLVAEAVQRGVAQRVD